MKSISSSSWTSKVRSLTHKYGLPTAHELLLNPPPKECWKKDVKQAIHKYHDKALRDECANQSSTRFVNLSSCSTKQAHHVWSTAGSNVREISRAVIKAKLLTGTYQLEGRKSMMNRGRSSSGLCPLCKIEIETRTHFLCDCTALDEVRIKYLKELQDVPIHIPNNKQRLTELILDPSHATENKFHLQQAEAITRRLCFALHHRRLLLLDAQPDPAVRRVHVQLPTQQSNLGCRE